MLTYESITIGQRVEVLHDNQILFGKVLYKGPVVNRRGLWIGVDLTTPHGDNDGTLKGRVYFRAPMNYGLFTTIDNVRLASDFLRKPRSRYRTVNKTSVVEEELFGNTDPLTLPPPRSNATISNSKMTSSLKNPHERPRTVGLYETEKRYPRSQTLINKYDDKSRGLESMMSSRSYTTEHSFAPTPSIPCVFMPPSEVDRAKRNAFSGMPLPRYTVVPDQHEFLD
ncbi:unnamed protein product [Adineta ricciae]|uniref:CAP-Gly domain-containing protein n=1 Tax=Adineta ricciae TaxID=249248 RepID=A0A814AQ39_ADIRI|nr:unnamed protein product [Adineta ricciae]CAF1009703.1 unnamed protein product [Adineta ricciae]